MRTGSLYWKRGEGGEYKNQNNNNNNKNRKRQTGGEGGGGQRWVLMGGSRGEEGWSVCVWVCECGSVCIFMCVLSAGVSMRQKLGGIESALTLCLYGPTVNGNKGPARSTAQPDDVTAHVPGQLGEAGGLQQERLLGLHGGLGAAAISHGNHVVGLTRSVTP